VKDHEHTERQVEYAMGGDVVSTEDFVALVALASASAQALRLRFVSTLSLCNEIGTNSTPICNDLLVAL